ncbi:hypothetical protein MTR_2g025280 [Medicago truncatula]|uniref:Uncharacterized protein n=1 Tax=Medicago truncatula TaxID=3880 RepID=G7ILS2_MEDTR|nr:hypothetical protein MTR_2g025280 [Medicago truncatula]
MEIHSRPETQIIKFDWRVVVQETKKYIKLIRTDTTLDLSQKAEKGMSLEMNNRCGTFLK